MALRGQKRTDASSSQSLRLLHAVALPFAFHDTISIVSLTESARQKRSTNRLAVDVYLQRILSISSL